MSLSSGDVAQAPRQQEHRALLLLRAGYSPHSWLGITALLLVAAQVSRLKEWFAHVCTMHACICARALRHGSGSLCSARSLAPPRQFSLGLYAYLWPKLPLAQRQALGPVHRFCGCMTWVAGLAAVATGIQEKVTFIQAFKPLKGILAIGPE